MLTPTYFTTNQIDECPQADHRLFEPLLKTPHYPFQVGTHSSEGIISLLWPSAWQSNKAILFYFTKNKQTNKKNKINYLNSHTRKTRYLSYRIRKICILKCIHELKIR